MHVSVYERVKEEEARTGGTGSERCALKSSL